MKISVLIILLTTFSLSYNSQSNSGIVTYHVEMIKPYETANKDNLDFYFNKMAEGLKDLEFELQFTQDRSAYEIKEGLEADNDIRRRQAKTMVGRGSFYRIGDRNIKYLEFAGEYFIISLDKPLKWTLTNESKKVGKYTCLKATATYDFDNGKIKMQKNVEAWFTSEIRLSYGPKFYYGLPGLILEVIDDNFRFFAVEIDLGVDNISIEEPSSGIRMTEDEFEKYVSEKIGGFFGEN